MGTQEDKERVAPVENAVEVTEQQVDKAVATRVPPKIYELTIQADGSVRVVTDISPDDMKFLLEFGLMQLMGFGYTVQSLAGFFPTPEESASQAQKQFLENTPPDQMGKA